MFFRLPCVFGTLEGNFLNSVETLLMLSYDLSSSSNFSNTKSIIIGLENKTNLLINGKVQFTMFLVLDT